MAKLTTANKARVNKANRLCPGADHRYPRLGKAQLPFGVAKPLLATKPAGVLRCRRLSPPGPIGHQVPDFPLALGVPDPTQGHPQAMGTTLTVGHGAQVAVPGVPHKGHGGQLAPLPLPAHFGPALHPDNELATQSGQHVHHGHIRKAPISSDEHPPLPNRALDPREHAPKDGRLIATHPPFQDARVVGAPIDLHCPSACDQRDHQQMLPPFQRPVDGQAHFPRCGQLLQGLGQNRIGQAVRLQPWIMQQARQAFDRSFLIPLAAGQFRLVARLFLQDRAHKGRDPFPLMPMCPGQHFCDIVLEASRPRVLVCHDASLARVPTRDYSPPNECVLTSVCLVVLWRVRYKLSLRDLAEMFLERGLVFTHEAVQEWEDQFAPLLSELLRKHRRGRIGPSWYTDKTYMKVKGRWTYLYRAIDRDGNLVDVRLSEPRDKAAAEAFFRSARMVTGCVPERVTTDGHNAYPGAITAELGAEVLRRTNRYLNNHLEQDHRRVKQRVRPMLRFKRFANAVVTLAGIELVHQIKKHQFDLSPICSPRARVTQMWAAVLAA